MKSIVILTIAFALFIPPSVFAQEELDGITDNDLNDVTKFEERLEILESQPSFDEQFVSSEEYDKLMNKLHDLESKESDTMLLALLVLGTFAAVGVALFGNWRTGNHFEEQNNISKNEIHYYAMVEIMKLFNDPKLAQQRKLLYEWNRDDRLYKQNGEIIDYNIRGLGMQLKEIVASVRGSFDQMGKLVKEEYVRKEEFLEMYMDPTIRMWTLLEPHIKNEREKRMTEHFMIYFEEIYNDAKQLWAKTYPSAPLPKPY